ncbi:MAG: PDC sensor domain-containing protein [Phycisphaerae bacterium]
MKTNQKTKRNRGFTIADKLYFCAVLVMLIVILSGWPPYSAKTNIAGVMKWSPDGDRIPQRSIERLAQKRFVSWAQSPIVVQAIKQANQQHQKSLDEIIRIDEEWIDGSVSSDFVERCLNNPCSDYLRKKQKERISDKYLYSEIFVMDEHGCVVAMTERTSDYWQADEDKFVKAFADGRGSIFVDESAYDRSSQITSIQVSVPVLDADTNRAIGVMTIGMNISVLDEQI